MKRKDPSASLAELGDLPPVAFSAVQSNKHEKEHNLKFSELWLLDGGCTDHMVADKGDFSEYMAFKEPVHIGGIKCEAIGIGKVVMQLQTEDKRIVQATADNVLHVPDLPSRSREGFQRLFS